MREIIDMLRPGGINPFFGESKQFPERFIRVEDLIARDVEPTSTEYPSMIPGFLDGSFGDGGVRTVPAQGFGLPAADKGYWVITQSPAGSAGPLRLMRLKDTGEPDLETTTDIFPNGEPYYLYKVQAQSDGKLILGGTVRLEPGKEIPYFARLNEMGVLDTTFGSDQDPKNNNGIVLIDLPDDPFQGYTAFFDFDIQPDNKIVSTLLSNKQAQWFSRVIRLKADGPWDGDFGNNGVVGNLPPNTSFYKLAVLKDNTLLLAGVGPSLQTGYDRGFLMRLTENGERYSDFGADGIVELFLLGIKRGLFIPQAINVTSSGDSVVVGGLYSVSDGTSEGWIARFLLSGELDETFNKGAILLIPKIDVYALTTQGDKLLFHGVGHFLGGAQRMTVGRLDHQGEWDPDFGTNGMVTLDRIATYAPYYVFAHMYVKDEPDPKLFVSDVAFRGQGFLETLLVRFLLT